MRTKTYHSHGEPLHHAGVEDIRSLSILTQTDQADWHRAPLVL